MTGNEAVQLVIGALEAAGVPYMVSGSYASNAYGTARATKDADFVVQLSTAAIRDLTAKLGPDLRLDPQITFESVTATTRLIVHVVGSPFCVELFAVGDDPHDQARFSRRRRVPFLGLLTYLPAAEDVVITKLRWAKTAARAKDRDDARNVIAVQADRLDWDYIHRWCDEHGTRALLDEVRGSLRGI